MRRVFILLSLVSLLFSSCDNRIESSKLIGNWKVVNFDPLLNGISPLLIEEGKKEALSTKYTFNSDNTFIMKSKSIPTGDNGTWKLNSEKEILILRNDIGNYDGEEFAIKLVGSSTIIITQELEGFGYINMTLEKE